MNSGLRSVSGDILFSLVSFELCRLAATFFPLRRTNFLVQTLYSRVNVAAVASCRLRTGRKPQYVNGGVRRRSQRWAGGGRPPELSRVLNGRADRRPAPSFAGERNWPGATALAESKGFCST